MKKLYMPSDELLLKMQSLGGNIHKYLLVKALESLVIDGTNYPKMGILKTAYKYLQENPDIAPAVCLLRPEEIKYSEIASYDANLANKLLEKSNDKTIYMLDNLSYFDESIDNVNPIIKKTINILDEYLPVTPSYRFDYKEIDGKSHLLSDIFSTKILDKNIIWDYNLMVKLSKIEPAYAVLIPTITNQSNLFKLDNYQILLSKAIAAYAQRYNITGSCCTRNVDLSNPNEDVKRLIKCIKNNKNVY